MTAKSIEEELAVEGIEVGTEVVINDFFDYLEGHARRSGSAGEKRCGETATITRIDVERGDDGNAETGPRYFEYPVIYAKLADGTEIGVDPDEFEIKGRLTR